MSGFLTRAWIHAASKLELTEILESLYADTEPNYGMHSKSLRAQITKVWAVSKDSSEPFKVQISDKIHTINAFISSEVMSQFEEERRKYTGLFGTCIYVKKYSFGIHDNASNKSNLLSTGLHLQLEDLMFAGMSGIDTIGDPRGIEKETDISERLHRIGELFRDRLSARSVLESSEQTSDASAIKSVKTEEVMATSVVNVPATAEKNKENESSQENLPIQIQAAKDSKAPEDDDVIISEEQRNVLQLNDESLEPTIQMLPEVNRSLKSSEELSPVLSAMDESKFASVESINVGQTEDSNDEMLDLIEDSENESVILSDVILSKNSITPEDLSELHVEEMEFSSEFLQSQSLVADEAESLPLCTQIPDSQHSSDLEQYIIEFGVSEPEFRTVSPEEEAEAKAAQDLVWDKFSSSSSSKADQNSQASKAAGAQNFEENFTLIHPDGFATQNAESSDEGTEKPLESQLLDRYDRSSEVDESNSLLMSDAIIETVNEVQIADSDYLSETIEDFAFTQAIQVENSLPSVQYDIFSHDHIESVLQSADECEFEPTTEVEFFTQDQSDKVEVIEIEVLKVEDEKNMMYDLIAKFRSDMDVDSESEVREIHGKDSQEDDEDYAICKAFTDSFAEELESDAELDSFFENTFNSRRESKVGCEVLDAEVVDVEVAAPAHADYGVTEADDNINFDEEVVDSTQPMNNTPVRRNLLSSDLYSNKQILPEVDLFTSPLSPIVQQKMRKSQLIDSPQYLEDEYLYEDRKSPINEKLDISKESEDPDSPVQITEKTKTSRLIRSLQKPNADVEIKLEEPKDTRNFIQRFFTPRKAGQSSKPSRGLAILKRLSLGFRNKAVQKVSVPFVLSPPIVAGGFGRSSLPTLKRSADDADDVKTTIVEKRRKTEGFQDIREVLKETRKSVIPWISFANFQ